MFDVKYRLYQSAGPILSHDAVNEVMRFRHDFATRHRVGWGTAHSVGSVAEPSAIPKVDVEDHLAWR